MKIILCNNDQTEVFETITVDPSTLRAVDSLDEVVVLFPRPGERDMTTLVQIVEEALRDQARPRRLTPLERLRALSPTEHAGLMRRWETYRADPRPGHHDLTTDDAELVTALANDPQVTR